MRPWQRFVIAVLTTVATATWFLAGVAAGDGVADHTEADDAGALPGSEQVLSTAPGSVTGTLGEPHDIDLYRFCAADQGFSVSTVNDATTIDTELFVFHGDGSALAQNDDRDGTYQSRVALDAGSTPAGEYLVAVGSWNTMAVNSAGEAVFDELASPQGGPATGTDDLVLADWALDGRSPGAYRIDVTGAADCTSESSAEVGVDVKPGGDDNPVNARSRGFTPIALLGSDVLDVRTVDPATFAAGPAGAPLGAPAGFEDVDHDGHLDFVGKVSTQEMGLTKAHTELCVEVSTADGTLRGCDAVRVR